MNTVRQQFLTAYWGVGMYPPQAIRARDVKGMLWFRLPGAPATGRHYRNHATPLSLHTLKTSATTEEPERGKERGRWWQHSLK